MFRFVSGPLFLCGLMCSLAYHFAPKVWGLCYHRAKCFPVSFWKGEPRVMSRLPSNRSGQSFIEFALIIILFAIVLLSILLILGDDLRTFINDLLQTWFPS